MLLWHWKIVLFSKRCLRHWSHPWFYLTLYFVFFISIFYDSYDLLSFVNCDWSKYKVLFSFSWIIKNCASIPSNKRGGKKIWFNISMNEENASISHVQTILLSRWWRQCAIIWRTNLLLISVLPNVINESNIFSHDVDVTLDMYDI